MVHLNDELPPQPRVKAAWYVACHSVDLSPGPVRVEIWDTPLVLWRGADGVGCLVDRCPHRGVPLSEGKVQQGELECAYHGWRFAEQGRITRVPGLIGDEKLPKHCAPSFPVREQQGLVWVWMDPDQDPEVEPFFFPHADADGYTTVRKALWTRGSIHQVIENALDVPHTAFLHGGLFRNDSPEARNRIETRIRRWGDRCEAQYVGEPRPTGLAGRLLSPSGGEVEHYDRFYLPSITEVEYRIGTETHLVLSSACTPHRDWETTMHAVVSVKTGFPGWLVKALIQPVALRIFRQDARMLERQVVNHARFGDERYLSTELDLLGPHILALLRRAAKNGYQSDQGEPSLVREVSLMV